MISEIKNNASVQVGFGSGLLNAALPADRPVREDVQVNAAFFRQDNLACCWLVLDFMDFDRQAIDRIKKAIAAKCGIPLEHIHILTTHNHAAGEVDSLNIELIALTAAETIKMARTAAVPAYLKYAQTTISEPLNYIRRIHVDEFAGTTTLFFGPSANNGFDCSTFLEHQISRLKQYRQICYSGQNETESMEQSGLSKNQNRAVPGEHSVTILHFEDENGAAIGNICRFAAHAICCNRPEYYSSDYPYYVRKYLNETLGGQTLFMNGPCGELAPTIPDKTSLEERRIGLAIGMVAVCVIRGKRPQAITRLDDCTREVILPVRDDLPSSEQAICEQEALQKKLELMQNAPLVEIKKLAERINFLQKVPFLREKWLNGESPQTELQRTVTARLGWLSLNDVGILAFPGETFSSTAELIRIKSGIKNLMTVTEHDRTLMYVLPAKEYPMGGYETTCCMTSSKAESILVNEALSMLKNIRNV